MDELTAVRQMLAEASPPSPEVVAAARARLEFAARGGAVPRRLTLRRPGRLALRRPWRLVVATGLAAATAAGLITAQVFASGRASPARALTVRELAYRAAASAARQPAVRPGQWVFWQEKPGGRSCGTGCGTYHVWTVADAQKAAWVQRGKVVIIGHGPLAHVPFVGQLQPSMRVPWVVVPEDRDAGWVVGIRGARIPVSYADLSSLPRDSRALDRYLGQLNLRHRSGQGSAGAREFTIIEMMLTSYVMPPRLTAELYRALGDIPGVTVNEHAADVAGRPGVGFISPALPGAGHMEIILNPRTYRLMGADLLQGPRRQLDEGTAILREALVSGPGVWP
jgi:hypothetical protein